MDGVRRILPHPTVAPHPAVLLPTDTMTHTSVTPGATASPPLPRHPASRPPPIPTNKGCVRATARLETSGTPHPTRAPLALPTPAPSPWGQLSFHTTLPLLFVWNVKKAKLLFKALVVLVFQETAPPRDCAVRQAVSCRAHLAWLAVSMSSLSPEMP